MGKKRNGTTRSPGTEGFFTDIERTILKKGKEVSQVRINGQLSEKPLIDLAATKLYSAAIQGSPHALNHLIRLTIEAERKEAIEKEQRIQAGIDLKVRQLKIFRHRHEQGLHTDDIVPHPDDIIIDHDNGFSINGPACDEDLIAFRQHCQLRDTYLLQHALEQRMDWPEPRPSQHFPDGPRFCGSAIFLALLINNNLPRRFQLDHVDILKVETCHRRKTKRILLKETYQAWQALNLQRERGWKTPPFDVLEAFLLFVFPRMKEFRFIDKSDLPQACERLARDVNAFLGQRQKTL